MNRISNKRRAERQNCTVLVDSKPGTELENIITVDISKSGIGLISSQSLPLNSKIAIELDFDPSGEPVLVFGEVRWVSPIPNSDRYRIGLTFSEVLSGSKTRISKYFKK